MKTEQSTYSYTRVNAGTATRKRGHNRVKSIVRTAKDIFLNDGYDNLKLQNIAATEGISLGNLTYYFKTKEHLFRTMIDELLIQIGREIDKVLELYPDDPLLKFTKYIDVLIRDCKRYETRAFFYQIWSLSLHDEFVNDCRNDIYSSFTTITKDLCRDLNPGLDERILNQRVFIFCSMIEGLHVMIGNYRRLPGYMRGFEKEFHNQALSLITK